MAGAGQVVRRRACRLAFVLACSCGLTACARHPDLGPLGSATMPHPDGCYVIVYEQPEFMGAGEYINGPSKYATLADLPFRANWRRRIRSAHVGPTASVILWDNEQFQGVSRRLLAQAKHAVLDELSGRVESLVVDCPP